MKIRLGSVALVVCLTLMLSFGFYLGAADKSETKKKAGAYTVVATDGSHLIVTDNQANTLYFYAIGPEEKIGDPLHLRGTVDLTQVGKQVITPVTHKKK